MKSFSIAQTLIYNPTLKSQKKKPIQSDIQQAKILAYFPDQVPIQQKCNTVGMAEGVYEFTRALLTEQQLKKNKKNMVIFMDNCCLVSKEYEENIWIFVKLLYEQLQTNYVKYGEEEDQGYIDSIITEDVAFNILDHFYFSFKTFYGPIKTFQAEKNTGELRKILQYFVAAYGQNNMLQQTKKLDICSYIMNSSRTLLLQINETLKFNYFKNIFENNDRNFEDIIVFNSGFLVYSTLGKEINTFFQNYFYGTGEPFKFQFLATQRKVKNVLQLTEVNQINRYGSFFNSLIFGLGNNMDSLAKQMRSATLKSNLILNRSQSNNTGASQKSGASQNLASSANLSSGNIDPNKSSTSVSQFQPSLFPSIYINKNGKQQKLIMTYFLQKKMLFITLYKQLTKKEQIIFQNKFYYDNTSKFLQKISKIIVSLSIKSNQHNFLYCNLNSLSGKSSIEKYNNYAILFRYIWDIIYQNKQAQVVTQLQNQWVYGINRLNRILILLIPNQVMFHQLDQFADKVCKEYFLKAYM